MPLLAIAPRPVRWVPARGSGSRKPTGGGQQASRAWVGQEPRARLGLVRGAGSAVTRPAVRKFSERCDVHERCEVHNTEDYIYIYNII